jgi:hypothetical protein
LLYVGRARFFCHLFTTSRTSDIVLLTAISLIIQQVRSRQTGLSRHDNHNKPMLKPYILSKSVCLLLPKRWFANRNFIDVLHTKRTRQCDHFVRDFFRRAVVMCILISVIISSVVTDYISILIHNIVCRNVFGVRGHTICRYACYGS